MDLREFKLEEVSKLNIYGNIIIEDAFNDVNTDNLKYINFFGKSNDLAFKYLFFIILSQKNLEMLIDSKGILNGIILDNKYNSIMEEHNILLLYLKLNIYIFKELNKIVPEEKIFQELYDNHVYKYQNYTDRYNNLIEMEEKKRKDVIKNEIYKLRLSSISFCLIISFYLFKDKKNLISFASNVENFTEKYLEQKSLNKDKEVFWKHLISYISSI